MGDGLLVSGAGPVFAVLGALEVTLDGAPITIRGARRRALLARLLVSANEVVATDTLIDDLWPDDPPENPTNALQAYLSHLRTVLGERRSSGGRDSTILTRKPGYLLSVGADRLDALRFEELASKGRAALAEGRPEAATGHLRAALGLWRGPALAEVSDEAWARPVAARLEEHRWAALEDRIEADLALGRHAAVVGELETAVNRQPLRERFHAQLMLALYRSGRQADALRAYQQVRALLGEELGIEPGPALRDLEKAILLQKADLDWVATGLSGPASAPAADSLDFHGAAAPSRTGIVGARQVSSPSFVGRSDELSRLRAALARAVAGEPAAVVVSGEAGVGKTRLVSELTTLAARQGALVVVGRCVEGGDFPYAPVVQVLRSVTADLDRQALDVLLEPGRAELSRLLPDLGPSRAVAGNDDDGSGRARMLDALLGVLGRLARSRALVLLLEDIHWADPSTLELLVFLVRSLRNEPILLVSTCRSDVAAVGPSLRRFLAELSRNALVERLELRRFTRVEVVAQLTGILGRPPDPSVTEAIWSRSGGNAFFAEELLTMERQGGGSELPPTLRDILLAHIEALTSSGQAVVRAIAAGGTRVSHPLLAAVVPLSEAELLESLREAVRHQVLVSGSTDDAYAFRHALLQEAAYGELLPGERRRLHIAYAEALTERPELSMGASTAADIAGHWFAAGDTARALPAAVAAGHAALARYGFAEARLHFERAVDMWDSVPDASERAGTGPVELLRQAAEAAFLAGDHAGAATLTSRALPLVATPDESLRAGLLQERLGRYLWAAGESEAALVAYELAAHLVPAEPPSAGRARVLAAQGQALMLMARYTESSARCEEAIAVARLSGDRATEGHARNTLGYALGCLGQVEDGITQLRDAKAIAEEVGNLDDLGRALLNLSELLVGPGNRLGDGLATALEALEIATRVGLDRDYGVSLRASAVGALYGLGRWAEAEGLLFDGVDLDPLGMAAIDLQLGLARLMVGTGRFDDARVRLEAARSLCSGAVDPQVHAPCSAMTAELALWEARPGDARDAVAAGLRHLEHTDDVFFTAPLLALGVRAEADVAELARDRGAASTLKEAADRGQDLVDRARALVAATGPKPPASSGHLLLCEAELSRLDGRSDRQAWEVAASTWERLGQPYQAVLARWRQAEAMLLQGDGSTVEPAELLSSVHAVALELGAAPLRHAVEDLAARHGIESALITRPVP